MPEPGAIIWLAITAVLGGSLALNGFLIRRGLDNLQGEVKGLRDDMKQEKEDKAVLKEAFAAFKARCEERHKGD